MKSEAVASHETNCDSFRAFDKIQFENHVRSIVFVGLKSSGF